MYVMCMCTGVLLVPVDAPVGTSSCSASDPAHDTTIARALQTILCIDGDMVGVIQLIHLSQE